MGLRVRSSNPFHQRGDAATERNPITATAIKLWAVYGTTIRRATVTGPASALVITWDGAGIALNAAYTVQCIAAPGNNANICWLGVSTVAAPNMRLIRVDWTAGTVTEVWTKNEVDSTIQAIYCVSSLELAFAVMNEVTFPTIANGIYYSTDGTTFSSAGQGYFDGVSLSPISMYAVAVTANGAARRIYTQHANANYLDAINTPEMLSYSDNFGVTWNDVLNSGLNRFAFGSYGFISLIPNGLGTTRVYYSNANGGGGIQTPYYDGAVTLNPQMVSILDSSFVEGGFYLLPERRYLVDRTRFWLSTDRGASWTLGTAIGVDNVTETRRHRGYSMLPSRDWLVGVSQASLAIYAMTDYATWQTALIMPGFGRAIAFVGGRN